MNLSKDKRTITEVVVYHDETKLVDTQHGKYRGHILFFVPLKAIIAHNSPLLGNDFEEYNPSETLYKKIIELKSQYELGKKLHFTNISGSKWFQKDLGIRKIVEISVEAFKHNFVQMFKKPLRCKLAVIFYPSKPDFQLYGGETRKEKQLRYDETMMRWLLKGASHYLYDKLNWIRVVNIYSDGQPEHRKLDQKRIVKKLFYEDQYGRKPIRDYVEFSPDVEIIHLPSDHNKYSVGTNEHKHANFLQLADLLLGGVTWSCYKGSEISEALPQIRSTIEKPKHKKDIIAHPIRDMLDKRKRGSGFSHSGHYKTFSLTEVKFEASQIIFKEVDTNNNRIFLNTPELDFGL